MEVIRANVLGFCGGVKRAVIMAEQELAKNKKKAKFHLETIGDLIHNKSEIQRLEDIGLNRVSSVDQVREGATVLIRAHGAEKEHYEALKDRKVNILEGICPLVRDIRNQIIDYSAKGYYVLLTGDGSHSEVRGLLSFATDSHLIESSDYAQSYVIPEEYKKVVLLSQSTWNRDSFLKVAEILQSKRPDILVIDTVCSATLERQDALRKLFDQVEAIVVIGSKHSANTLELFWIAKKAGLPVWHCENSDDLPNDLHQYKKIGLSAGASSPEWRIREVENSILAMTG